MPMRCINLITDCCFDDAPSAVISPTKTLVMPAMTIAITLFTLGTFLSAAEHSWITFAMHYSIESVHRHPTYPHIAANVRV